MNNKIIKEVSPLFFEWLTSNKNSLDFTISDEPYEIEYFLGEAKDESIIAFAKRDNGSLICFWKDRDEPDLKNLPVIYLDINRSINGVLAKNFDEFLMLLYYGLGNLVDILQSWFYFSKDAADYSSPFDSYDSNELKERQEYLYEDYPDYKKYSKWLKNKLNLHLHPNPVQAIKDNLDKFPGFDALVKKKNK